MQRMNHKQRLLAAIDHETTDRTPIWLGCPHGDSRAALYAHFGVNSNLELQSAVDDDMRWFPIGWQHPEGKPGLDPRGGKPKISHNQPGIFADTVDVAEVERAYWPDPQYADVESVRAAIAPWKDTHAIFSGVWAPFFHNAGDYFGMDNYFVKMHTDPAVVEAVTEHIVDYYYGINEIAFSQIADDVDVMFFGNDFGTQLNTFVSPESFRKFILPGMKRLTDQARRFGLRVALHSCGSVYRVIPDLINIGVEALHPIQAKASNMEAERLKREFGDDLCFIGGIDTQELLCNGTAQQVRDEVRRIVDVFGTGIVVSPSHEAILPDVPPSNVEAMFDEARAYQANSA
jgi:uroporphyrinogen decarboxylase